MINAIGGINIKKLIESRDGLDERFYIRARQSHIIVNYIPTGNELRHIRCGHKVHMFMTNMNFMSISALLPDFISDVCSITRHRVTIHVPHTKKYLWDTIEAILWLNFMNEDHKVDMIPFNNPVIFKCSDYHTIDSVRLLYIDDKGLVCTYCDELPQFYNTSIEKEKQ